MADEFTAKFKVDISDLKQNISEANKQIKLANATFKAETAGMDKWSKDADGLSSKLKQLKTVLEQQKTILSSYKGQMEQQQQAYTQNGRRVEELKAKLQQLADSGVAKTSEEYKKYQKELKDAEREQDGNARSVDDLQLKILGAEAAIGETERSINHYNGALDDLGNETEEVTEEVAQSSEGFTVFKGVLADLAASAIKAVVQGLKDMGGAVVDAYKEFDEGMDNIIKMTGATGDAAADLQEAYKGAAGSVVADMGDIGSAVGEVNTRFGITGQDLEDLSVKFLKFADLNGTDVTSSIDSVQAAMAAFGVETDSAGDVLDILNQAAQNTGVPMDQLTSSLLTNGTALQAMGFGINTAVGFLSGLEKSGVDTSAVLGGLKKALANATKEGKPLDHALAEIQESMTGAESDTAAAQAAMELFGNKAGPAIAQAVRDGRLSFDELSNTVTDFGDSVDSTYANIQDGGDYVALAMQNMKAQVGEAFGEFIDEHGPQIKEIMEDLTNNVLPGLIGAFSGLLDALSWVADHSGEVVAALAAIAAGAATYLAYQTALTVMNEGWKALTVVTKAQTIAQTALNTVMAANPIGILIAAIAALVVAFTVLWNTNEDFRKAVVELWNNIKEKVVKAVTDLKDNAIKLWNDIKENVSKTVENTKAKLVETWENIKATVTEKVEGLKSKVIEAWETLKSSVTEKVENLKAKVIEAWENLKTNVTQAVENVKAKVIEIWENIKSTVTEKVEGLKSKVVDTWENLKSSVTEKVEGVKTKVTDAWENIKSSVTDKVEAVKAKVTDIWDSIKSKTSEVWENVKSSITTPIENAKEAVRKAVDTIKDKINNVKLEFPKIKLPHFSVSGGEAPWGLMGKGSMPKISVSWYARGGVINRPTILTGVGENGAEAVVPLERNKYWIREVAKTLEEDLRIEAGAGGLGAISRGGGATNYTQIINAPKQPSRIELYRQTRNLLALKGGTA